MSYHHHWVEVFSLDLKQKGAFGEVRKAIHKSTSIVRAVKIIFKDNSTPQELKRITNEVDMLKKLVRPFYIIEKIGPSKHYQSI